jgi:hypothetical protein
MITLNVPFTRDGINGFKWLLRCKGVSKRGAGFYAEGLGVGVLMEVLLPTGLCYFVKCHA